jgi:hypothetical protein
LEKGKENWIYGFGGRKRGVELRICRKEGRKGDLSLLNGKMNGKYYFEGKKLGMES